MAIYRGTGGPGDSTTDTTVTTVTQKATEAAASATAAASSATSASSSASSASTSAANAATSETNAATSATSAASSATSASTSATTASSAATSASTAQTAAETAQTAAEAAKTAAETAETNAASSASSASSSATSASTSATNAATSATNAATSASSASSSATSAASAQTAAESARDEAVAAQEAIDGLYLGAQTSDPSVDLNGDPVTAGDWYYNTATDVTRIYDGTQWVNGAVNTSSFLLQGNNLSDLDNAATARTNLGLGTAATTASTDYATAAQGTLADSAVQPGDNVSDLTNDAGYLTSETYTGTVTSVAATVPTGLTVSGSPITTSGTLSIAYDTGYSIPTDASQTNWNTAYGWGDHSTQGYLTSYTETDPVFSASEAASITSTDTTNWDTAYGWGDHSTAGYLTSYTETDPVVGAINGIVKANGAGTISAAVAGTDYLTTNQTITLSGDITGSGTTAITTSLASNSVGITELDVTDGTSGQVLSTNGAGVLSFVDQSGGGGSVSLLNTQTFTSSGTWTKPASGSFAIVYAWGGGGQGGSGGAGDPGGGGGGGCFIARRLDLADLGSTETVTIGAGGSGSSGVGANGGTTTFGSHISAYGGSGGGATTTHACGGQGGGYSGVGAVQNNNTVPQETDNSITSAQLTALGTTLLPVGNRLATYGGVGGDGGNTIDEERYGETKNTAFALFTTDNVLTLVCEAGAGGGATIADGTKVGGNGGDALFAGAGGGGAGFDASPGAGVGGTSAQGGDGGDGAYDSGVPTSGTQPAGGGGGGENVAGADGGDGKCIVYVYG